MSRPSTPTWHRIPGIWKGIPWAMSAPPAGGVSRPRLLWRTLSATVAHPKAMMRWMSVAFEQHSRGVAQDLPAEYLRAVRPYVHRGTNLSARVVQLIDHVDWVETAFAPEAFSLLAKGEPLVLAELPAPRGYDFMRLQLQRTPSHSPEGELLLTLTLQRSPNVQPNPQPMDAAAMGFSRFRVDGMPCLVIGGVRGQRHPVLRLSSAEISQALCGWQPAVLMVRVAQELARHWGLHVVGLDPSSHRLQGWPYQWRARYRDASLRIYNSYDALWEHFEAKKGPPGWMIIPLESDEKLEATALSPEKRARQTRRADYWIRTRNMLRLQFRQVLQKPAREDRLGRMTESETLAGLDDREEEFAAPGAYDMVPARVLQTAPGTLL